MVDKILVTGATGTIGRSLIASLQSKGVPFVAGVTNEQRGKDMLGADVPLVELNYENPLGFQKAVDGVTKVFLLGPPLRTDLYELVMPFIEHLNASGIKRVVYLSALGLDKVETLPFHSQIVEALIAYKFQYTILQPTFFAQNFKNYEWENITQRGISFVPAGEGKVGFVDVDDIALVAATVLIEEGHIGKTYTITGPELHTYADAVKLLSEVTGKTIHYTNPSQEFYAETLQQAGAPDFIAPYMNAVYSLIAEGKVDLLTKDVELLTGKKPTPLRVVLERDFASVIQTA